MLTTHQQKNIFKNMIYLCTILLALIREKDKKEYVWMTMCLLLGK